MMSTVPGLQPFSGSGYAVAHGGLNSRREVAISSLDPLRPRLGDVFTVESRGVVHEVAVVRTSTFKGGWSAVCRVCDVF